MDYLCGIQVAGFGSQGSQFACLRIPRRRYAVFVHREHIAGIRRTWDAIWNGWLPRSGHEVADAPLLERYDDHLHPQSGRGGFSLLVPLSLMRSHESRTFGVYLRVANLDRSRAFYERVLGKQPYVSNAQLVGFDVAGALLALYANSAEQVRARPQRRAVHPCAKRGCRVRAAQEAGRAAARRSVIVEGPLKLFRFADPDGNVLELFSLNA